MGSGKSAAKQLPGPHYVLTKNCKNTNGYHSRSAAHLSLHNPAHVNMLGAHRLPNPGNRQALTPKTTVVCCVGAIVAAPPTGPNAPTCGTHAKMHAGGPSYVHSYAEVHEVVDESVISPMHPSLVNQAVPLIPYIPLERWQVLGVCYTPLPNAYKPKCIFSAPTSALSRSPAHPWLQSVVPKWGNATYRPSISLAHTKNRLRAKIALWGHTTRCCNRETSPNTCTKAL